MWVWIAAAFGLFVVYRAVQLLLHLRAKSNARHKRIESALAEWQKAHPGEGTPVDVMLKIAEENWNEG